MPALATSSTGMADKKIKKFKLSEEKKREESDMGNN